MTWCNNNSNINEEEERALQIFSSSSSSPHQQLDQDHQEKNHLLSITNNDDDDDVVVRTITCPSCGHTIKLHDQRGIQDLPGLPAGVKFDPNDQEILEHLEAKVLFDTRKLHPLIDEFIPTIQGDNGICYTHPEKLPGVRKDGQIRHFFHRPSKAYTTGTRKRRKVSKEEADGGEMRWHKTGKTRAVVVGGVARGYKKILVLYTNYGRQRKPEKTNWVMHQYHLGDCEEEKDGELVVSKVFYQTHPRQCNHNNNINTNNINTTSSSSATTTTTTKHPHHLLLHNNNNNNNQAVKYVDYHNNTSGAFISSSSSSYNNNIIINSSRESPPQLIPNLVLHGDAPSSFIDLSSNASKPK